MRLDNRSAFEPGDLTARRIVLRWLASPLLLGTASPAFAALNTTGFVEEPFEHGGIQLSLWSRGAGPTVFILHEMNGLTQNCFALGDDLVAKGFSVVIPRFFGDFGGGVLGYFRACELSPLFRCYDHQDAGPITPWIKALALRRSGNGSFGVIGNCMTGALPLLMLRSPRCAAPVLCQPAFPFRALPGANGYQAELGLAPVDIDYAVLRSTRDNVPVLAVRFENDKLCPAQRMATLRTRFGSRFHCVELQGEGHSTLITHRCDVAFEIVVSFLQHRLMGSSWNAPPADCLKAACAASVATHGGHR